MSASTGRRSGDRAPGVPADASAGGRDTRHADPGAPPESVGAPAGRPARRAIVLVHNPVAPYSRALRIARSLNADGWEVLIAGTARGDLPAEERDGPVRIVRIAPAGPLAFFVEPASGRRAALVGRLDRTLRAAGDGVSRLPLLRRLPGVRLLRAARTPTARRVLGVLRWPLPARAWSAGLRRSLPPADLYHACGVHALLAATELAAGARREGRAGRVVYDVIDLFLEGNRYARMPAALKALYVRRERALVARADAVVTVNDTLADELVGRFGLSRRPLVVLNCPPAVSPEPAPSDSPLRAATGLPAGSRLVLFLGILGPDRGLLESGEAVLRVRDAAFVTLGFGPWFGRLRARDADPRFRGRHVTLPPVHPDEVTRWAAGADAVLIAVPGDSLNQRLSTPNKFWEGLAAGVPLVVGRDLRVMREIVERHDLGAIADPADVDDLAEALRAVLDAPEGAAATRRERALGLARERYNWAAQAEGLLQLAAELVPR